MSKLKFRVWDGKKFLKGRELDDFCISVYGEVVIIEGQELVLAGDEYSIQQFTGLKDKNGKEIYEGDIVSWSEYQGFEDGRTFNGRYEAKWNDEYLRWDFYDPWENTSLEMGNTKFDLVVGNIFENPELLGRDRV
jgi:uncharacterized phage protein (TIGR01671 family)